LAIGGRAGEALTADRSKLTVSGCGELAVYRLEFRPDVAVAGHHIELGAEWLGFRLLACGHTGTQAMSQVFEQA
jgi:hypothetical protein